MVNVARVYMMIVLSPRWAQGREAASPYIAEAGVDAHGGCNGAVDLLSRGEHQSTRWGSAVVADIHHRGIQQGNPASQAKNAMTPRRGTQALGHDV